MVPKLRGLPTFCRSLSLHRPLDSISSSHGTHILLPAFIVLRTNSKIPFPALMTSHPKVPVTMESRGEEQQCRTLQSSSSSDSEASFAAEDDLQATTHEAGAARSPGQRHKDRLEFGRISRLRVLDYIDKSFAKQGRHASQKEIVSEVAKNLPLPCLPDGCEAPCQMDHRRVRELLRHITVRHRVALSRLVKRGIRALSETALRRLKWRKFQRSLSAEGTEAGMGSSAAISTKLPPLPARNSSSTARSSRTSSSGGSRSRVCDVDPTPRSRRPSSFGRYHLREVLPRAIKAFPTTLSDYSIRKRTAGTAKPRKQDTRAPSIRNVKCQVIHYIDTHYAKQERIASLEDLAQELFRNVELKIWNSAHKTMRIRDLKEVRNVLYSICGNSLIYGRGSRNWGALVKRGSGAIKQTALKNWGYEQYCLQAEKLSSDLEGYQSSATTGGRDGPVASHNRLSSGYEVHQSPTTSTSPVVHDGDLMFDDLMATQPARYGELSSPEPDAQARAFSPLYAPTGGATTSDASRSGCESNTATNDARPGSGIVALPTSIGSTSSTPAAMSTRQANYAASGRGPLDIHSSMRGAEAADTARVSTTRNVPTGHDLLSQLQDRDEHKRDPDGAPSGSRSDFTRRIADFTLYLIDADAIATKLGQIFGTTRSYVREWLSARDVDPASSAEFSDSLTAPLQPLYQGVMGTQSICSRVEDIRSYLTTDDLVVALIGCFLHRQVFQYSDTNLETYDLWLQRVQGIAGSVLPKADEVLEKHRRYSHMLIATYLTDLQAGTDTDTVLRNAYFNRCSEPTWISDHLSWRARQLAQSLARVIVHHIGKGEDHTRDMQLVEGLYTIILDALVLSCKISTARESQQVLWYEPETEYHGKTMQEASHPADGRVMLTLFPGLALVSESSCEIVARARIARIPRSHEHTVTRG